jgi:hypothetical protein
VQQPAIGACEQVWVDWLQVSVVHGLLSLQSASVRQQPGIAVWMHWPVLGSHVSVVQTLLSLQSLGEPVQTPAWQVSFTVHGLPSLQAVPSATLLVHVPVPGLHALHWGHETVTSPS